MPPTLVELQHRTHYAYGTPTRLGPQLVRLEPAPHCLTPILSYDLAVRPGTSDRRRFRDPSGNVLTRLLFAEEVDRLDLVVTLAADLADRNPFDFIVDPEAVQWPFAYPPLMQHELAPYCSPSPPEPEVTALVAALQQGRGSSVDMLVQLNRIIHGRTTYLQRLEVGTQSPAETIQLGSGSCRDSAWLLVHAARALGFAARFVSGYLIQLHDPANPAPGLEADGADLHAWAEMYLPGAGWIGFDATSGLITGPGHIPLACTANPASAAPVTGTSAQQAIEFITSATVVRKSRPQQEQKMSGFGDHP